MNAEVYKKLQDIFNKQKESAEADVDIENPNAFSNQNLTVIDSLHNENSLRIQAELTGLGPLDQLIEKQSITEILVNSYNQIFYEENGFLKKHPDLFFSEQSYRQIIDRLSQKCDSYLCREKPFVEKQFGHLRVTIIFDEISRGQPILSIRKQPLSRWTLEKLYQKNWCNQKQYDLINQIINHRKNFLVVGGTGSGKTSFLQSLLESLPKEERIVIIEDTQELHLPNEASASLLTRQDPSGCVSDINMDDLLKRALRLRPDRLTIGEIRGAEAKSLLMAMATGHDGSFGSLHARTAHECLLRLEMLIQMGAPQWSLQSIRRLIGLTIQNIFVIEKKDGQRQLQGIYQISSVEESGITLMRLDEE